LEEEDWLLTEQQMSYILAENYQATGQVDLLSVKILETIILQQELSTLQS